MKKTIIISILAAMQTVAFGQIYSDSGTSSFEILSYDEKQGVYYYKTVEIRYGIEDVEYFDLDRRLFAKYITTTKSCPECAPPDRNVTVELRAFDNPQEIILRIDKKCDEIKLDWQTYQTITYPCCDWVGMFEMFDYKHNSIIQAHKEIIIGEIPQSHIKMYVGYEYEFKRNSSFLGTLYLSYNSGEKYEIKIKLKELPKDYSFASSFISPEITILTENAKSEYQYTSEYESEVYYDFESLKGIKNESQINGLKILLEYRYSHKERLTQSNILPVEIPIINGKPFGKDTKTQEIEISF